MNSGLVNKEHLKTAFDIQAGKRGLISKEEYENMRANSYDREMLLEFMSNEAFESKVENTLKNVPPLRDPSRPPLTYSEAAVHSLLPDAMRRLEVAESRIEELTKLILGTL